jgi:integrase
MSRRWERVRRKALPKGVRPLKLHATRHTWATLAFSAGKSPRLVADQLGHADPSLTLRYYAHALREEETDLSFAEFGDPRRPFYTAPA